MADSTKIEWTDATWNPVTGCTLVSEGCRNCYAARLAATRLKDHPSRRGLARVNRDGVAAFTGEVRFNEQWLDQPLRWRKPRRIFVCAHGDLFHESVPDEWIDRVFAVMAAAHWHTFQVLTKRPSRARSYFRNEGATAAYRWLRETWDMVRRDKRHPIGRVGWPWAQDGMPWPLPNVWLGVSIENQGTAAARVPELLATPAAVRFVSAEPLLGAVDLNDLSVDMLGVTNGIEQWSALDRQEGHHARLEGSIGTTLDWVIVGGESGPGARPMHPDWARSLRDQCQAAGVPYFFKQWGEWAPWDDDNWSLPAGADDVAAGDRAHRHDSVDFLHVGKARAGRLLDGREWNEMPAAAAR